MLFNSIEFWLFFAGIYTLYLLLEKRGQNLLLLAASYFFYAGWDYRFLALLLASTIIDYFCGIMIHEAGSPKRKTAFLTLSIGSNLLILGFFKYYNFFIGSFGALIGSTGVNSDAMYLHILLPVGISFYTFQTMTYTIDIWRGQLRPTRNFTDYALFVAFFPKLVAGPIERARAFLPQIAEAREVSSEKIFSGAYLVLWGLFKKVFIADNLMRYADAVFAEKNQAGFEVLLGVYAFAFQIYADFSGYTDIARGVSRLLGFELSLNFRLPYFSKNPKEFWQRWHISLSTWLRDYIYIPLGGSREGAGNTYRNLLLTMTLCGLWHGAAWHYVLWGVYWGILLAGHRFITLNMPLPEMKLKFPLGPIWNGIKIIIFFHITCVGWLIFRAESLSQILAMGKSVLYSFSLPLSFFQNVMIIAFFIWFLMLTELMQYRKNNLETLSQYHWSIRSMSYIYMLFGIFIFGAPATGNFIYFQF